MGADYRYHIEKVRSEVDRVAKRASRGWLIAFWLFVLAAALQLAALVIYVVGM